MSKAPVFVFSSGFRSGSTLLQRLLTSSKEILIWGESGGALDDIAVADEGFRQMLAPGKVAFSNGFGGNGAAQYAQFRENADEAVRSWIPCMNAPLENIRTGFEALFREVYEKPAIALGYNRWGVKEVRSGLETAGFLSEIFPDAKFVFLVRDPFDCMNSLKRHKWMDRPHDKRALEFYANHWSRLAGEFKQADFGYLVRYEDLVSEPAAIREMRTYLEMDNLDFTFISTSRVKGNVREASSLTWCERRRVKKIVDSAMRLYGYDSTN